ncbi:MAG: shikimate kinase [Planctomycetota bacterium]|nr:shikimate kinase [Planctomycetota bacterium]
MSGPLAVFLIGYRGSGKSSVGRPLAARLHATFVDSDRLIEEDTGTTIARVFEERGEDAFRDLEEQVIARLAERASAGERLVVGAGGGAVLRAANVERMRSSGTVVWLSASAATLSSRILADRRSAGDRPALEGHSAVDEVEEVLARRLELYRRAAHVEVSTEGIDPDAVAARVREVVTAT